MLRFSRLPKLVVIGAPPHVLNPQSSDLIERQMSKSNTRRLGAIRLRILLDIASLERRDLSAQCATCGRRRSLAQVRRASATLIRVLTAPLIAATPIGRPCAAYRRYRKCAINRLPPAGFRSSPLARTVSKYAHPVTSVGGRGASFSTSTGRDKLGALT